MDALVVAVPPVLVVGGGDQSSCICIFKSKQRIITARRRRPPTLIQNSTGPPSPLDNNIPPPRWFTPLECRRISNSPVPLLLYLPGIDGTGLGLVLNHRKLGQIFDVSCLHIPAMDRTPFGDLVELVERRVGSENCSSTKRPIYLVGESIGACLALSVAARNPHIDLVLILANPATSFKKSPLQLLLSLLDIMPEQLDVIMPYMLSLITGAAPFKKVKAILELSPQEANGELSDSLGSLSSCINVLGARDALIWKLQMLRSASAYANSRLHAVKAQTLILSSGMDLLLPSREEGERLFSVLPNCEIRRFKDSGHVLFLEDEVDLVSILKGASFYRRARDIDYASDYIPPTASEFHKISKPNRWIEAATSPVMLSTLEDGKIVRGLAGVPSQGPVVYVGYHMLFGWELYPLVTNFMKQRNILLRGISHPLLFNRSGESSLQPEVSTFDSFRAMGAVPASPTNFYKLLSLHSHVLLYPGGTREALHRRGEEYKLFWPEQSEFIRMAARFGAKIVPFGVVGEDDFGQVILNHDDLMVIPHFRALVEESTTADAMKARAKVSAEVANLPIILPQIPGRFYYLFGKPIETEGRKQELRSNRRKTNDLYAQVKLEVEKCILFLKEKREHDPYRSLFSRLIFHAKHGIDSQVPTFEI